ncbi:MAG TPA: Gfo/Idh/MocA family oxidoreductase [archaeon]|nr:Gfo/Idh/MocA family oxidoreductase [archaeon]
MEKISRKKFVKTSGAALTAGLAFGSPAVLKAQSPAERLNIGIIGTGSRGCYLIREIVELGGLEITDVCDVYPPHLEEGLKEAGGKARTHEDYRKLLEQKEIDVVFVVTPLVTHVTMCLDALRAGKHIYCEKSMGYSVAECNQLVEAVKANPGRVVQIGYGPHGAMQQKVRELIQAGSIGQVTQVFSHYHRNSTWIREDVPEKWWRFLNWRLYWEYCGGIMTELVSHQLTMINWVLDAHPLNAVGQGGVDLYKDHERETWDNVNVVYEYPGGIKLNATGILSNARYGYQVTIMGTHGTIELGRQPKIYWEKETRHLDSYGVKTSHFKVKLGQSLEEDESPSQSKGKLIEVETERERDRGKMLGDYFACVRQGGAPAIDAVEGRRSSISSLLANRAIREGRKVTWEEMESLG